MFLCVYIAKGLFHSQDRFQRAKKMDDVCCGAFTDALKYGHQVMVFVYSHVSVIFSYRHSFVPRLTFLYCQRAERNGNYCQASCWTSCHGNWTRASVHLQGRRGLCSSRVWIGQRSRNWELCEHFRIWKCLMMDQLRCCALLQHSVSCIGYMIHLLRADNMYLSHTPCND